MAHWPAPAASPSGPTGYQSQRVPPSCSPKCGPYFGDRPPTMLAGLHGDALGPSFLPRRVRLSPSLPSGVGGSVNGKLGTTRHCRSHETLSSPSTYRGSMDNERLSYILRPRSNYGPTTCYPWSRVPSQNNCPSPWTGKTALKTCDPPLPFPAPGYCGPLTSLVEYCELPAGPPNCHGDLQLSESFDHVAGRRVKIHVPI